MGKEYGTNLLQIDYNDPLLVELLTDMFEISCIESYNFYHKKKDHIHEGELELISDLKLDVVNKIKDTMFQYCDEDTKSITYKELFEVFREYYSEGVKLIIIYIKIFLKFLSSEYFRRITFTFLKKGNTKTSRICCGC